MKARRLVILSLGLAFLSGPAMLFAQEEEEQGHVYTISTWKVGRHQLEEYLDLLEKELRPLLMQNSFIKSYKLLTHRWGPDWNILTIIEFEKFEDIAAFEKKMEELWEQKYPSKSQRDRVLNKLGSYILAHTDAIVQEVPKLTK